MHTRSVNNASNATSSPSKPSTRQGRIPHHRKKVHFMLKKSPRVVRIEATHERRGSRREGLPAAARGILAPPATTRPAGWMLLPKTVAPRMGGRYVRQDIVMGLG
ncbi:hypothetical protein MTO96_050856 [Rhipicephalus appendiculatus]